MLHVESMKSSNPASWQILFGLWSLQASVALYWLVSIPTDTDNPFAFGFSTARFILICITVGLAAVSVMLWFLSRRAIFQAWLASGHHIVLWDGIYLAALSATLATTFFLALTPLLDGASIYSVHAARLRPIVFWVELSGFELALLIGWGRYGSVKPILTTLRPILRSAVLPLFILSILAGLIVTTRIGITPEEHWGDPPVPFLEWQIIVSFILIGILMVFPQTLSTNWQRWIPFGLYACTVILWLSQPVNPSFSATPPRAPNYEIYPFSDAQFYAQYAQAALTGNGFSWPQVPARPLYVAFLTWLHLLGKQNYQTIVVLQTLVLAVFPALLYFLGKEIGGQPLGLGLALLTAFRDYNSNIVIPLASNATYSKLLLSELPSALLISLATLLTIRWLRGSGRGAWFPFMIGAVLGAAALIRLQSSILVISILLLAFLVISDRGYWFRASLAMVIGFVLVFAPWMVRNFAATGGLVLDNPVSQTMTIARRWSGSTTNEFLPPLPGESDAQYSSRLTKMAIEHFTENPGFVSRSAANHFINSEIASILALPARDRMLSPSELFLPRHAFWKTPLTASQAPFLVFYLFLFSIGVAAAWHYHRLIGLLPLGLGLMYNLWTALFLSSGARFVIPLDWSIHLYEILGLLIVAGIFLSFVQGTRERVGAWIQSPAGAQTLAGESPVSSRHHVILSLVSVVILAGFLPFTEFVFPQKYPPKSQTEIMSEIGAKTEPGEIALYGRAIYPRYYQAREGEATDKLGYAPSKEPRLVFVLIGPQDGLVIFRLEEAPEFFPHTSDVYMLGTLEGSYFSARVVKVVKDSRTALYTAPGIGPLE